MAEVFICYDEHDEEIATRACQLLEENELKCWLKYRDADTSDVVSSLMDEIRRNSKLFILILSKHAAASNFVSTEVDIAFSSSIPFMCLNIDGVQELGGLAFFITNTQIIDGFSNLDMGLDRLVVDSCKHLGMPVKSRVAEVKRENPKKKKSNGLFNRLFAKSKEETSNDKGTDDDFVYGSNSLRRPFKAYRGDEDYIFVSYAHKDAELVFPEIKRFHDKGYPIWYDQGLTPGQEWDEEIEEALQDCSLLVVFISANSMASSNVVDEIKFALGETIDIVPIYLEEAKLARGLKLRLSQKHAIMKYQLYDEDYIDACFKAFDSAGIPKIR